MHAAALGSEYPVLVPRRADGGRRDAIWSLLQEHVWQGTYVEEGHHDEGAFNRSAALNRAVAAAGDWEYAIVADSDSFVPRGQLVGALQLARTSGRMVIAHSRWVNVDVDETQQMLEQGWLEHRDDRQSYAFTVSSMLVVPRSVWDTVNGFDERFTGWGREDNAFARACKILTGAPLRIDGSVFHLAHDRPVEDAQRSRSPLFQANERKWRQYLAAKTPADMGNLVAGNRLMERAA